MGEGMTALSDFGDAIYYYRYFRVPDKVELQDRQEGSPNVGEPAGR